MRRLLWLCVCPLAAATFGSVSAQAASAGAVPPAAVRFGTFVPDELYSTLASKNRPAAHKRVQGDDVALDFGAMLTDPTERMVLTEPVTNDFRIPTKCVVSELQDRQDANGWSAQQLENEVAKQGFLLPIDEARVPPGPQRVLYTMGAIRYRTAAAGPGGGGDYLGLSCTYCHASRLILDNGHGRKTLYAAFGAFGGVGQNHGLGIQLLQEAVARALKPPACGDTPLGPLTTEERVELARIATTLSHDTAADGVDMSLDTLLSRVSLSSFIGPAQASTWYQTAFASASRRADFGTAPPASLNLALLLRPRALILGAGRDDPLREERRAAAAVTESDATGIRGKHVSDRPASSWWGSAQFATSPKAVLGGAFACRTGCTVDDRAWLALNMHNSRAVMGPLDHSVLRALELPPATTGEAYGRIFLDADAAYAKSKQLLSQLTRSVRREASVVGPQPLPGLVAARGITVQSLTTGMQAVASHCRPCHNGGTGASGNPQALSLTRAAATSTVLNLALPAPVDYYVDLAAGAEPVPAATYLQTLQQAFLARGDGDLVAGTAGATWFAPAGAQGVHMQTLPARQVLTPPLFGVFGKGRLGTCGVGLAGFFDFFGPEGQPDLIAVDGLSYDATAGGFTVKAAWNVSEAAGQDGKFHVLDRTGTDLSAQIPGAPAASYADAYVAAYTQMAALYDATNVWSIREESACPSRAQRPNAATPVAVHKMAFPGLTVAEKKGLTDLLAVLAAAKTPGVPSGLDDGKVYTVVVLSGAAAEDLNLRAIPYSPSAACAQGYGVCVP